MEEAGLDHSPGSSTVITPEQIFLTYYLEKEALALIHHYRDSPQPVSISLCVQTEPEMDS